jgi:hypothetical protein
MPPLTATIHEHGEYIYITTPVQAFEPEQAEIETFAFADDLKKSAPNPRILWMRGQYVEADKANRNADEWTAGELAIKALTPVLMPVTVMHDLRSAVGTIADAKLLTPEKDQVPRARIDTTLALWEHRFPEVAKEARVNAAQGTLMQSMECLSPCYDCGVCGKMMTRGPKWQAEWKAHTSEHGEHVASGGRPPTRILRSVTFTGVGLIFGTRGARGAMPSAHLEVEELAAMHREAHSGTTKRPRRKSTVEIEDSKYEAMVKAQADADAKLATEATARTELERRVEALEAAKVKAEEELATEKSAREAAEQAQRVAAMRDERMGALGTGFRAKLDKLETTSKNVKAQAATLSDEEWEARLAELEESLAVKRDAKVDEKPGATTTTSETATAGLLFDRKDLGRSTVAVVTDEITANEQPSPEKRHSVMDSLVRGSLKRKTPEKAQA